MDILATISQALDATRTALLPYYLHLKFVHLFAVMIWSSSTMVAYVWYVPPTWAGCGIPTTPRQNAGAIGRWSTSIAA